MERFENFEAVQATSGEYMKPSIGGYICKIVDVEDVKLDPNTGKGKYLKIDYDIASGDFEDFYKEQFEKWGANNGRWGASFMRSYKESAIGMFKHFIECIEKSNKGFAWDWNEKGLVGKEIGLVLGEEEYKNNAGEVKKRLYVYQVKTVDEIKKGDFKLPALKKLKETSSAPSFAGNFAPPPTDADVLF